MTPVAWEEGAALPAGIGDRLLVSTRSSADGLAVVTSRGRWTHAEFDSLVARWASRLSVAGVLPGTPVGLCAVAELEVAVGFFAIHTAGGVVVPLDPALPPARLRAMAEGSGCLLTLVSKTTCDDLQDWRVLNLSGDAGNGAPVQVPHDPDRPAVIYHTSGSTGRPKPVAISHRVLASRMLSMAEWFGIGPGEVVCGASTLAFDPFLQQLFFPLCGGGTLWLPDRMLLLEPARFWAEAARQRVTHLNLVPSQIEALLQCPPEAPLPGLRRVVLGGERMPPSLPARIVAALGPVAVFNMYGPTEATVDATGVRADTAVIDDEVPIGRPLPGCRVRILDEQLRRVPVGEAGELCIGGVGLAIGYRGMPEATELAFVPDPFGVPGDRLYRTGDMARWLPDGQIGFIGRRDDQVKIRGQRIELNEVEAAMRDFPGVTAAAACKWEEAPGGAALIAHITGEAEPAALRAWLAGRLPAAAVPVRILRMGTLPALPSGKIDRKALPRPEVATPAAPCGAATLEQKIAAVWAGLLERPQVDVHANLFEMGAHSLLVSSAVIAIQAATGQPVTAVDLFRFPTIAGLTRHLTGESHHAPGKRPRTRSTGEIAIAGLAFRLPGSSDPESFWADLVAGADRVRRLDRAAAREAGAPGSLVDHPDFIPAHAALSGTDCFDPLPFGYSHGEAAEIDPQQRLLLELAWHALEDASCDPAADGPVGIFAGVGFNAYLVDNLRDRMGVAGGADRFSAVMGGDKDFAATRIAYKLGLTGLAMTVNSACSTALSATTMAVDSLRAGRCRVALVGAASLGMFSPFGHIYAEGGIASRSGVCRPFDAAGDGVVSGAGAAVLLLKRLEDAVEDGDSIYAVIRGIGISNDGGQKAAFSAPSVDGQAAALAAALEDAGVAPSEVGFVEGHGTATQLGDPIEVAALNLVYRGADPGSILLGSVKGNLGHLDAAAGMAGLIKAVLAVRHGVVPPTAHFTAANPRIPFAEGPFRVNAAPEPWPGPEGRPRLAGVSAFGMGGTNIHVILGAAPAEAEESAADGPVLLTLSAPTASGRAALGEALAGACGVPLPEMAGSLARRRPLRFRRATVAASAIRGEGAFDGEVGNTTLPVALLFPGQGAQQAGMARSLYHVVPAFRAVMDEAAAVLRGGPLENLPDLLLATAADPAANAALAETERTQPALFLTEYGTAKALEAFGVRPAALMGHSIGEYVAACLAGVMEFEDALRLVMARGRVMASAPRGAMLAVSLAEADLLPLLARCGADLAAVNGPRQCVASGTVAQVTELEKLVTAAGKMARRLPVSHAFHSAMMDPVLDTFAAAFAKVRLSAPAIPVVSNVTGDWMRAEEATDPGYWVRHLRRAVRFADGLRRLTAHVLVETGPGAALTRMARTTGVAETHAMSAQPSGAADGYSAFLEALGRLWVAGVPVDRLAAAGKAPRRVHLPGYPFERMRLWIEPGTSTLPVAAAPPAAIRPDGPPLMDTAATAITEVWQEVLGVPTLKPDDQFLELGGDSLIAVRIAARLRQRLGCEVAPDTLFREGTVAALARALAREEVRTEVREEGWL